MQGPGGVGELLERPGPPGVHAVLLEVVDEGDHVLGALAHVDAHDGPPHGQVPPAGALVVPAPPAPSSVHLGRCVDERGARGGGEARKRHPQLSQLRQLRPDLKGLKTWFHILY